MSKDIPIIFSGPMVRALLDGRKTMTRRIVKNVPEPPAMDSIASGNKPRHPAPYLDAYCSERASPENPRGMGRNWCWWTRDDRCCAQFPVRYAPGDRLWVRENWRPVHSADPSRGAKYQAEAGHDQTKWKPSIHMPRWASRLTLIVTGVKVERLQDISEADAQAEGVERAGELNGKPWMVWHDYAQKHHDPFEWFGCPARSFQSLWETLHGAAAWTTNPYVVALTFTVHKQNIDMLPKAEAA